jgi:hypothetical protein
MTHRNKIDQVISYALAAADQEDFGNRELGPIHLIKYVYLADLAFAEANAGQTFTGVVWRFYHFGPWSEEIYERIEPTVRQLGAAERRVPSKYADDALRWSLDDVPGLFERLDEGLPSVVSRAVKQAIHRFGQDTSDLLHFIYTTPPMLKAAPGEILSFTPESMDAEEARTPGDASPPGSTRTARGPLSSFVDVRGSLRAPEQKERLSKSAQRWRAEKVKTLRERVAMKLKQAHERPRLADPSPEPRFDEVFLKGSEWLNQQAGEVIQPEQGEVGFSADLWKSRARGEKLS